MLRDLTALRAFCAIAGLGSFAKAADRLGISKAMASKHVADLEAQLGAKLINRTTRQLSLTEAGRRLEAAASNVFGILEEAEQDIQSSASTPRGVLRVNAPMSFGVLHLTPIVNDFLARHPDVEVELKLDDALVNVVEEGYDVAIRIRELGDSSLLARRLAPARMIVAASPAYLAQRGEPAHPRDLTQHDCLVYDYLARQGVWTFEREGQQEDIRIHGRLRGNNGEVLVNAAIAGHGVALAPSFIAHEALRSGALRPILCDWSAGSRDLWAVMPPGRVDSPKVRAFVDHLVKAIGKSPYWDRGLTLREDQGAG